MSDYSDFFKRQWPLLQQAEVYSPRPNPTFHNPDFASATLRVLIARLSPFQDVSRSTPHLFLAQAARRALPKSYVDLAFFPPQHDRARFAAADIPFLVGIQSCRSADDFDVVLISNAYTLELLNLPYLLLNSGIPLMASERDARWPPLILGGSNALATQALITGAGDCMADAIFFGEGEGEVETLLRYLHAHPEEPKRGRLAQAAAHVTGLWVANTSRDRRIREAIWQQPGEEQLLVDYPNLNSSEAGTARMQLNFGCPAFCSFCFEGYDRKPYREVPLPEILATARRLKREQGAATLDLYSFNFNTHSDILTLLLELNRLFERVSFKSQRVDVLYATPGLLTAEIAAGKRSFTLGIEGLSERMRAFLHKSLATASIRGVLTALLQEKIRELKLFYILTGHETEADLAEFREFVRWLKTLRRRAHRGARIIFSCGRLIRMPFTPLRHDRLFLDEEEWRDIVGPVKSTCETNGFEFRMATPWDDYCVSQVLALGGTWLHEPLIALAGEGHCYDTRLSPGYWNALRGWMKAHGHWTTAFWGEKGPDYPFALDFVRPAVEADFLYRQYQQAREGIDEGYCLGEESQAGRCLGCGACSTPEQRQAITSHAMRPPETPDYRRRLPELMRAKWRLQPLYVHLRLPPGVAGVTPEWLNAWVLRRLLSADSALTDKLLAARESLFTTRENRDRYAQLYGETIFALTAWDTAELHVSLKRLEEIATPDITYLGVAEGFAPGSFRRMRLEFALPTSYFPAAGQRLRDFLRERYVPVNVRREGAGYRFDLPAKALKKKVLFAGTYAQTEESCSLQLLVSPKFDLRSFLRSFSEPARYRQSRVAVCDLKY